MAWETRKGTAGRYYTRSHTVNGRTVREYVGTGAKGEAAACMDARRRAAATDARIHAMSQRQRFRAADDRLAAYCADVDAQLRAALIAAGYRQHDRGEWRRKRGSAGS